MGKRRERGIISPLSALPLFLKVEPLGVPEYNCGLSEASEMEDSFQRFQNPDSPRL